VEETKGENFVVEESNRSTAILIYDKYFAKSFSRKNNEPMTYKRFMR